MSTPIGTGHKGLACHRAAASGCRRGGWGSGVVVDDGRGRRRPSESPQSRLRLDGPARRRGGRGLKRRGCRRGWRRRWTAAAVEGKTQFGEALVLLHQLA